MHSIQNTWVEKVRKKKEAEKAPAYEAYRVDNEFKRSTKKPENLHIPSLKTNASRTLRGVRK